MGHRALKFSWVKEWPTHTAQLRRPIIHSREHIRAMSLRPDVVSTRWVLQRRQEWHHAMSEQ
jgi:hypothetical protein